MSRKHTLFALAAVALVGCESPQDKARIAEQAQITADRKVDAVIEDTEHKEQVVQVKANLEMAQIRRDGDKKIGEADLAADRRASEAAQALWAARDAARAGSSTRLDGFDHDIVALRPLLDKKLSTAAAADVVSDLQAKASAVRKRIADFDQCSADDLESVKTSVKGGLDDLGAALAAARKRA